MKSKKLLSATLLVVALYIIYAYFLRQGKVIEIYKNIDTSNDLNCNSTVVLVDDVPLSRYAQKRMWFKSSNQILAKAPLLTPECDIIIFLKNKTERAYDAGDTHYWVGDYQYCLNGAFGNERCISKQEQLFSIQLRQSTLEDEKIGLINTKTIYIHFIDY